MCGLAGIHFDDAQARPDPVMLRRMIAALGHRGPDGEGYLAVSGIGLGHARLGIVDPEGGAQPIHNEDKSIWIASKG
jgi:asparagine synthase (glutamine-hydrolysing)